MANVLVYLPTFNTGSGLAAMPESVASVRDQSFSGEWTLEIGTHNPYEAKGANVTAQYQRARRMVLDGGYDALLTVEHDMLIPPHALQTLWDDGGDVVYAVYVLRHGTNKLNAFQWTGGHNLGMSLDNYPDELTKARQAGRWRVSGVSNGCTLIRRHVLEAIDFRTVGNGPPDIEFAKDVLEAGFESYARFDVLCGHWCDIYGEWLWPFRDNNAMTFEVTVQKTVTTPVGRFKTGQVVELPAQLARDLERAGYVSINREPEPEPEKQPRRGKRKS